MFFKRLVLSIIIVFASSSFVLGQDTTGRHNEYKYSSILKQDSVIVQNSKKIEFSPFPVLAYAPETNLQFGVFGSIVFKGKAVKENSYYRPSTVSLFAIYSLRNQILFGNEMDLYFGKGWNLYTYLRLFSYPDFYYGIGSNTIADSVEVYTEGYYRLNGRFLKTFNEKLFFGLAYDFQQSDIYDLKKGKVLEQKIINGSKGGNLFGIGPSLRYDTRDNVIYPTKGSQITAEALFYNFGTYNYSNFTLDARQFYNIGGEKNVIGMQLYLNYTDGNDIPFFKLPRLGGQGLMRGIIENRYRDNQAMYFQTEYRRIIKGRFGAAVFGAIGSVAPSVDQFNQIKVAGGLGIRYKLLKESRLNIRVDYGIGTDGQSGIYFTVREAF
jgi:outer membrane protein assembly factor BamA